jgi:hypothetical protein
LSTVYPKLFAWPPLRSLRHALERLSIAVLVAGAVFELVTGLLNTAQWYPWSFSFVPVHYAVAWLVVGALLLHLAVVGARHQGPLDRPVARDARPAGTGRARPAVAAGRGRRAAVGAVTLTTVGQSFTSLKDFILFAPRHPDEGPQGLPVNRTAAAAGVGRISRRGRTVSPPGWSCRPRACAPGRSGGCCG